MSSRDQANHYIDGDDHEKPRCAHYGHSQRENLVSVPPSMDQLFRSGPSSAQASHRMNHVCRIGSSFTENARLTEAQGGLTMRTFGAGQCAASLTQIGGRMSIEQSRERRLKSEIIQMDGGHIEGHFRHFQSVTNISQAGGRLSLSQFSNGNLSTQILKTSGADVTIDSSVHDHLRVHFHAHPELPQHHHVSLHRKECIGVPGQDVGKDDHTNGNERLILTMEDLCTAAFFVVIFLLLLRWFSVA